MKPLVRNLRGVTTLILFTLATALLALTAIPLAIIAHCLPVKSWRRQMIRFVLLFPVLWIDALKIIMKVVTPTTWDVHGEGELKPNSWYLMTSNHRSWVDILIISEIFNRRLPILKFFMKHSLIWTLPIAGFACYLLGYPFVRRHTRKAIRKNPELRQQDIKATKEACQKFKELPTTIIIFAEGRRFTAEKHQSQNSPYKHLLKPRAGGMAMVLKEMEGYLEGIVDVTLSFEPSDISFWDFMCGRFDKIKVHYRVLPITPDLLGDYYEDRAFRKQFQDKLNTLWQQKDACIDDLMARQ